jgi:hypothetical protein
VSDNIRPLTSLHCPVFLVNSRYRHFTAATKGSGCTPSPIVAPLLPKLRGYFAEFLLLGSLEHLRLLASSTCVGLRYGLTTISLRGFSWQPIQQVGLFKRTHFLKILELMSSGFTYWTPYDPNHAYPSACMLYFLRHHIGQTIIVRLWNINHIPIAYAFRPRLRGRLTLGRLALPRKP